MDLKELETFALVAELGSMTKAAQAQTKTVMAVSKQIAKLEHSVKHPLFERSRRQLRLTEYGTHFLHRAKVLLEQHKSLKDWVSGSDKQVSGHIRVLTQSTDVLNETIVPFMAGFIAEYPDVTVALDVKESLIDVKADEYDIYWGIGAYLGDRFPGLKRRGLWQERYGIFASPEYLAQYGTPLSPDKLDAHQVVGYLYNQPNNVLILQDKNGEPIYATPQARVTTVSGMVELAQAGLGLVNAPVSAAQIKTALADNTLSPVLEAYWWEKAEVFIYFHQTQIPQPKVSAFIDYFVDKKSQWAE